MSRRLAITLGVSIALHFGLLACFAWLSLWPQRQVATLSDRGGVVWFNLNPGGSGEGGEGGLGAPEASNPNALLSAQKSKNFEEENISPKNQATIKAADRPPIQKKEKSTLKETPMIPKSQEKPVAADENKEAPPGWKGPGQGDSAGNQTGPGGGSGEGLGNGEGSGSGSGKGPGGVGAPGTGGSGSGGESSAILAQIRKKIARAKRYPRQARAEELEGATGLQFEIQPDGTVSYVNITSSSGHPVLDDEALATVRRAAPFPYYAGPIRFSLRFSLHDR